MNGKFNLDRINFINYGTAMPIKNAGRPKGSKTTKRSPKINAELKYEIHTRRSRSTLWGILSGVKPSSEARSGQI